MPQPTLWRRSYNYGAAAFWKRSIPRTKLLFPDDRAGHRRRVAFLASLANPPLIHNGKKPRK